ncbi:DUF397 domain-containing protein [Nocardia sp. NPDC052112]|uniref:DUF397 domain-containing protein n=1 Tax=Nocardia sp. NPDC052112 TaxID=3155646 RepID=UPI0034456E2F
MTVDLSGARWFKSSRSASNGQCVEVAFLDGGMFGVRDSKPDEWDAFAVDVYDGEFERRCADRERA